jgi:hypothetical protein
MEFSFGYKAEPSGGGAGSGRCGIELFTPVWELAAMLLTLALALAAGPLLPRQERPLVLHG